jgi:hypothetical protein
MSYVKAYIHSKHQEYGEEVYLFHIDFIYNIDVILVINVNILYVHQCLNMCSPVLTRDVI